MGGETDIIVKALIIEKKAQFSMIELYRTLKTWFELHSYLFFEREYEDTIKKDKKSVKIKWEGRKEADDYTLLKLPISITLNNYEIHDIPQGKIVEGELKIKFSAEIETDFEEKWSNKPAFKFTRAIFDKFVASGKRERFEKEITEDCHDIFNRSKSDLNLQKFQ